jgi:hypothetical protein
MDDGAVRALRDRRKSLFSAGITDASGDFQSQDAVALCDAAGVEFARGLVNFTVEVRRCRACLPAPAACVVAGRRGALAAAAAAVGRRQLWHGSGWGARKAACCARLLPPLHSFRGPPARPLAACPPHTTSPRPFHAPARSAHPPSTPQEVRRIKGSHSGSIQALLGYEAGGEVVHRENLALLTSSKEEGGEVGVDSGEDSPGAL